MYLLADEENDNDCEQDESRENEEIAKKERKLKRLIVKQRKKDNLKRLFVAIQQSQTIYLLDSLQRVNQDVLYVIYIGSVSFLRERRVVGSRVPGGRNSHWFEFDHPALVDQPPNEPPIDRRLIFKNHYRITLRTFNRLVNRLMLSRAYAGCVERPSSWSVMKQVAIVLWRFANTSYGYRLALTQFKVGNGSYNEFTNRFVSAMVEELLCEQVKWPSTPAEFDEITRGMARGRDRKPRLANCCGATNGKLVAIAAPGKEDDPTRYIDYKNRMSMSLQAVCDHRMKFTSIMTGMPGSFHDARCFKLTPLYNDLVNHPEITCMNGSYVIGDAAYPLLPNLLVPYTVGRGRTAAGEPRMF